MPTILLSGGPGAGKSTVALALATQRQRCAVIEVDDVRHMLRQPHVAPWGGEEGRRQQLLGVRNSCALAANFADDGCDVVITDVLTDETAALYRHLVAGIGIAQLTIAPEIALRRAEARHYQLTREEFVDLHVQQAEHLSFDIAIDSGAFDVDEIVSRLTNLLDPQSP